MDMTLEEEEFQAEKEQAQMWIDYLSRSYAQQQMGEPDPQYKRAKKDFEKMLKPKEKTPEKVYEWDFDPNELIEGR